MQKLNREGLFHPMLFCEQKKREGQVPAACLDNQSESCQRQAELLKGRILGSRIPDIF